VADDVELAEGVSIVLMLVLETLSPTERAVFVLREVFDVSYEEIAGAVDKSLAAVRQIAHRARQHVDDARARSVISAAETGMRYADENMLCGPCVPNSTP
jgi:DNA-directed RNA polymerase specialized sigma24 family protein